MPANEANGPPAVEVEGLTKAFDGKVVVRDLSLAAAAREVQRYVPSIGRRDLLRGPWGVRAQQLRRDGTMVDDFALSATPRVVHVRNAPSPAATAALAIGDELRRLTLARL